MIKTDLMVTTKERDKFYSIIESRKSIRQFRTDLPPKEMVDRILHAAMHAPSGKNRQNWRFFVVSGQKKEEYLSYSQKSWLGIKDLLEKRLKPSLYKFTERFFFTLGGAPYIIFCYTHNSPDERSLTSIGSVYMAVQNINLACQVEGLGCCTMGAPLEIEKEVGEFLGLSNHPEFRSGELQLLCAVVIGYPDHEPPKPPRQTENRVTWIEGGDELSRHRQ